MGYYLVRQNNETIIGPLSLSDLSQKVASLEITMADEVTGNLGPWVFLDSGSLAQFYPEISSEIAASINWESEGHSLISSEFEFKLTSKGPTTGMKRNLTYTLVLMLLGIGFFLYQDDFKMLSKLYEAHIMPKKTVSEKKISETNLYKRLEIAYAKGSPDKVESVLSSIDLQSEFMKKSERFYKLLPYIRYVAFSSGTASSVQLYGNYYKKVADKILVGYQSDSLPERCDFETWKNAINYGNKSYDRVPLEVILENNRNLKALLWNPTWISTRASSGWLFPKNMHHACILQGLKVLKGNSRTSFQKIALFRLNYLSNRILDPNHKVDVKPNNFLLALTCIEGQYIEDSCMSNLNLKIDHRSFLIRQKFLKEVHLSIARETGLEDDVYLPLIDPITKIDYSPESKYIDWYIRSKDALKAKNRLAVEYPNFSW